MINRSKKCPFCNKYIEQIFGIKFVPERIGYFSDYVLDISRFRLIR